MPETLERPAQVHRGLLAAAWADGVSPTDWIAARLPKPHPPVSDVGQPSARELLYAYAECIDSGQTRGGDNSLIEADLASEYAGSHGRAC